MAFAEIGDIEDRWVFDSRVPDADSIQATLDDAELLVRVEFPDIDDRIAAEAADETETPKTLAQRATFVVCRMVLRYLQNPDGKTQQTIGTTATGFKVTGRPGLYLEDEDRAMLVDGGTDAGAGSAFTIDTTPAASPTRAWASDATLAGTVVNSDDAPGCAW